MTRSKHEISAIIKSANRAPMCDSVLIAFSYGMGRDRPLSGGSTPFLLILFDCERLPGP